jgi:hypothetical protein
MKHSGLFIRSTVLFALGIALVIGLLHVQDVSFADIGALFHKIDWLIFAGIVAVTYAHVWIGAVKWRLISARWQGNSEEAPHSYYLYYSAQTQLLSQFLSQALATLVLRSWIMKRKQNISALSGAGNAFYDLLFDFLIAVALVPASLLQLRYDLGIWAWLGLSLAGLGIIAGAVMLIDRILPHLPVQKSKPVKMILDWRKHKLLAPDFVLRVTALSTARFALVVLRLCLGVAVVSLAIPLLPVIYATPLATMPGLIPATPANLGVAEWAWAYILAFWNVPVAVGAAYAISFRIIVLMAQSIVSFASWQLYKGKRS